MPRETKALYEFGPFRLEPADGPIPSSKRPTSPTTYRYCEKPLGDGTDGAKLIETVPKRGYRFAALVSERPRDAASLASGRKRAGRLWVAAACGAIALAGLAAWAVMAASHRAEAVVESVPLTA
jgi:hypothetical protein